MCSFFSGFVDETELNWMRCCAAMRIQLSESIYDNLVRFEPKFITAERGLRNVLVSVTLSMFLMPLVFFWKPV